jgi:hypothetical protein
MAIPLCRPARAEKNSVHQDKFSGANELKKFPLGQTALPGRQTSHARDVPFLLVDVQSRFHTGKWMISGNNG